MKRESFEPLPPLAQFAKKTEEHLKGMVSPATLFEEIGFNYIGPIDGHDLSGSCDDSPKYDRPSRSTVFARCHTKAGLWFCPSGRRSDQISRNRKIEGKVWTRGNICADLFKRFRAMALRYAESDSRLSGSHQQCEKGLI